MALPHVPVLLVILIGALSIMAGGTLFVGAFLLPRPTVHSSLPSMRDQTDIPPPYDAIKGA
jgi:hypothetical protein